MATTYTALIAYSASNWYPPTDATWYDYPYDTVYVSTDSLGEFNTGTYTFTPSQTADYIVIARVRSDFINQSEWCQMQIDVDGSPVKYGGWINAQQGCRNVTSMVRARLTLSSGSDLKIRFRNNCAYDKWTAGGVSANSLIIVRVF